jgi:hypothetical protein
MGSSNFLQHNPDQANQENDATYLTDVTRTGGIVVGQLLPSPWLNKVWYQSSTFVAAFSDALAAKGYTVSDANRGTLESVLANILTTADMPLPVGMGGTGATSFALAGLLTTLNLPNLAQIIKKFDQSGMTTNGNIFTMTLPQLGVYRISAETLIWSAASPSTFALNATWVQGQLSGASYDWTSPVITQVTTPIGGSTVAPQTVAQGSLGICIDVQTALSLIVNAAWSPGGAGDKYDLHVRVEQL